MATGREGGRGDGRAAVGQARVHHRAGGICGLGGGREAGSAACCTSGRAHAAVLTHVADMAAPHHVHAAGRASWQQPSSTSSTSAPSQCVKRTRNPLPPPPPPPALLLGPTAPSASLWPQASGRSSGHMLSHWTSSCCWPGTHCPSCAAVSMRKHSRRRRNVPGWRRAGFPPHCLLLQHLPRPRLCISKGVRRAPGGAHVLQDAWLCCAPSPSDVLPPFVPQPCCYNPVAVHPPQP